MVVFQLALTVVLLTGAGIFTRSLLRALAANPEVPAQQISTARIGFPDERYKDAAAREKFYDQLLPRIQAIPGVTNVAVGSDLPGLGANTRPIEIEHAAPLPSGAPRPEVAFVVEGPSYLDVIHLPLLMGRHFNETDGIDNHKATILTRECAEHFWPNQEPIGKRFHFYDDKNKPGDWITVVGVSANIAQQLDEKDPKPLLFVPYRQEGWNGAAMLIESSGNPISAVRAAVQSLDPNLPLRDIYALPAAIEHQQWYLHVFSKLFGGFALIALVMASVGLYAVIAQATSSRTQEIGVRMALGANARDIMALVMKRGLWQIAIGLALGLAAAFPVGRLMASMPIGAPASDPALLAIVSLLMGAVGLFACWLPARKAAALDPVKAIRCE